MSMLSTVAKGWGWWGDPEYPFRKKNLGKLNHSAIDLVQRARVGDQNAVAMLMMLKKSALAGGKLAKTSMALIDKYIKENPVPDWSGCIGFGCSPATQLIINRLHSRIGEDPSEYVKAVHDELPRIDNAQHAAVPLANLGNLLTDKRGKLARTHDSNPRIKGLMNKLPNPGAVQAFMYGLQTCNKPLSQLKPMGDYSEDKHAALHLGRSVGIARKIQAVRLPNVSIATISPMAAWELGE